MTMSALIVAASCFSVYRISKEKNAFKLEDIENYTGTYKETNIGYILNIYAEMFSPGKLSDWDSYEKTSEGRYEITLNQSDVIDLFSRLKSGIPAGPVTSPDVEKLKVTIEDRVLSYPIDYKTRLFKYNLFNKETRYDVNKFNQAKEEIEELPASAIIDCGMYFRNSVELKDFLVLQQTMPDSIFTYIYTHDMEDFMRSENAPSGTKYFGFAMLDSFSLTVYEPVYENIDLFNLYRFDDGKRFESDAVTSHCCNCLEILLNCGLIFEENNFTERMKLIQKDIENNGISVIAFRACLTKDDALKLLEDEKICHVTIADVKISKYAE